MEYYPPIPPPTFDDSHLTANTVVEDVLSYFNFIPPAPLIVIDL
jgi:hypothetical protein